jgi:uncharacterized repeat protein (TIGR01451 family)
MKVKVIYFLPFFLLFAINHSMAQYTFTGIDVYPLVGNNSFRNFPLDSTRIMNFTGDSISTQARYTLYDANFNQISTNVFPTTLPFINFWNGNIYKVDANGGSYFLFRTTIDSLIYCKFDYGGNLEWITSVFLPNFCSTSNCSQYYQSLPYSNEISEAHELVITHMDTLNGFTLTVVGNNGTLITQTSIAGIISGNETVSFGYPGSANYSVFDIWKNPKVAVDKYSNVYFITDTSVIIDTNYANYNVNVPKNIYKVNKYGNLQWKNSLAYSQNNSDHEFEGISDIQISGDTIVICGVSTRQFVVYPYYTDSAYTKSLICFLDSAGNFLYKYISADSIPESWQYNLGYGAPMFLEKNSAGDFMFLDLIQDFAEYIVFGPYIRSFNSTNFVNTQIADISAQFNLVSYCDHLDDIRLINYKLDPGGNHSIMFEVGYCQNNCTDIGMESFYFQFSPNGTLLDSSILNDNYLPAKYCEFTLQNGNILKYYTGVHLDSTHRYFATYEYCFNCIASVEGEIYYDAFNNCQNFNEPPTANSLISFDNGQHLQFTNSIGVYNAFLDSGPHTIEPLPTFPYWFSNCQTLPMNLSAPAYPNTSMGNDLALALLPNVEDVVIWNHNYPMRPGFDGQTVIQLQNLSTVQANGTLRIDYPDSIFTYLNATPQPDTVGVGYLAWNYVNIPLFSQNNFNIMWNIPISIPINTPFNFDITAGNLMTDTTPANNVINYSGLINGSFDPNDKQVSPAGIGPEGFISQQDSLLTYLVRYQNTGTDTAFTVKIEDIIDDELNLASISIDFATHPYSVELKNRKLVVTFSNILLPDSGTNYANSMGAIQYSIKLKPNLFPGTEIKNVAAIYFDFNAPVITNTVTNTIEWATSVTQSNTPTELPILKAYPNPFGNTLHLEWNYTEPLLSLTIWNLQGQKVGDFTSLTKGNLSGKVDLGTQSASLPNGIYFLKAETATSLKMLKVVKQ